MYSPQRKRQPGLVDMFISKAKTYFVTQDSTDLVRRVKQSSELH